MKSEHVRAGVRLLAWGTVSYVLLSVAYVAIIVAANW